MTQYFVTEPKNLMQVYRIEEDVYSDFNKYPIIAKDKLKRKYINIEFHFNNIIMWRIIEHGNNNFEYSPVIDSDLFGLLDIRAIKNHYDETQKSRKTCYCFTNHNILYLPINEDILKFLKQNTGGYIEPLYQLNVFINGKEFEYKAK